MYLYILVPTRNTVLQCHCHPLPKVILAFSSLFFKERGGERKEEGGKRPVAIYGTTILDTLSLLSPSVYVKHHSWIEQKREKKVLTVLLGDAYTYNNT